MNKLTTVVILVSICVLIGLLYVSKSGVTTNSTPITLEQLQAINPKYEDLLAQITSPDNKLTVIFAVIEEGNRNVSGDILLTIKKTNSTQIIRSFSTVRFEFNKTLSFISNTEIKFVESNISSNNVYSREQIINLVDNSKNIDLPELPKNSKGELSEHITAYTWINENTLELQREFYDQIGTIYPAETWQYNVKTREYRLVK